jgi:hypothetical protein
VIVPSRPALFPFRPVLIGDGWTQIGARHFRYDDADNVSEQFPSLELSGVVADTKYEIGFDLTIFDSIAAPNIFCNLVGRVGFDTTPDAFNLNNLDDPAPQNFIISATAGDENNLFRFIISDNTSVDVVEMENMFFRVAA